MSKIANLMMLPAALLLILQVGELAAETILSDDASDPGNSADIWKLSHLTPGSFDVAPGKGLTLTPTNATPVFNGARILLLDAEHVKPSDFSIRARVRRIQTDEGDSRGIGFLGRWGPDRSPPDFNGVDGYSASINPQGELGLRVSPVNGLQRSVAEFVDLDVSAEDVMLRFDVVGNQLSLWAWQTDARMPTEPNVTLEDDPESPFESGWVGLLASTAAANGPNEFAESVFRFVHVGSPIELEGDFNDDGILDINDIDALSAAVLVGANDLLFDVTWDGQVDKSDVDIWVKEIRRTWFGDSNLDGEFNSADLVGLFQAGEYEDELVGNSRWSTGDWDADGEFTSGDLVIAFQDGGFEQGPIRSVLPVPEPTSGVLLAASLLIVTLGRSRIRLQSA